MMRRPPKISPILFGLCLGVPLVLIGYSMVRPDHLLPLFFRMVLVMATFGVVSNLGKRARRVAEGPPLVPYRRTIKRRDEGIWRDPPVAELDKSTFGKLLASRLRREPGLRVVVRSGQAPPSPDPLYDAELDA